MKFEDMKLNLYSSSDRVYLRSGAVSDGCLLSLGNTFGIVGVRRIPNINKKLGFDLDEKRRLRVFKGDELGANLPCFDPRLHIISRATALYHKFILSLVPGRDAVTIFDATADLWLLCVTPRGVYRFSYIDDDYILPVDHLGRLQILR